MNSLQHPYWATVENPRLAQRRALDLPPDRPSIVPPDARILRAADDDGFVSLGEAARGAPVLPPPKRPAAVAETHEACFVPANEAPRVIAPREPHKDVKARSKWKRRPGTHGRFSQTGGYRGVIVTKWFGDSWTR